MFRFGVGISPLTTLLSNSQKWIYFTHKQNRQKLLVNFQKSDTHNITIIVTKRI